MENEEALKKFNKWYVEPINKLKELPDGNGGFVTLMVGLTLFERLIYARLKINNQQIDEKAIRKAINDDLRLTDNERRVFWDLFRNGLLHQAMPKFGDTGYLFHDSLSGYPVFKESNGHKIIYINPWKFTDRVITEFLSNPELLLVSDRFPFPLLIPKQKNALL